MLKFWVESGAKGWKSCRSRKIWKNAPTLAIVAVDTAENEPFEVCPLSVYRSLRLFVMVIVIPRRFPLWAFSLFSLFNFLGVSEWVFSRFFPYEDSKGAKESKSYQILSNLVDLENAAKWVVGCKFGADKAVSDLSKVTPKGWGSTVLVSGGHGPSSARNRGRLSRTAPGPSSRANRPPLRFTLHFSWLYR